METSELFEVSSAGAFNFFYGSIHEEVHDSGRSWRVTNKEIAYVASVLAHHSQVSIDAQGGLPIKDLSSVFDSFFVPTLSSENSFVAKNSEVLEIAGSYTLLFAGFFRDQSKNRHNLSFYDSMGKTFYCRSGIFSKSTSKARLMERMGENFPSWTVICRNVSRNLRENQLLLRL